MATKSKKKKTAKKATGAKKTRTNTATKRAEPKALTARRMSKSELY